MTGTKATAIALVIATFAAGACGGKAEAGDSADGSGGVMLATGGAPTSSGGSSGGTFPGAGGISLSSGGDTALGGAGSGGTPSDLPAEREGTPPSCDGFQGDECQGGDCCASLLVPSGVVFVEIEDVTLPDFYLDKYEVTVARFREYMNAVGDWIAAGNPEDGAGAHPLVPESGWRADWMVAESEDEGVAQLEPNWLDFPSETGQSVCCGNPTYQIEGSDQLAVNQLSFHAAFAFCIWDGGRLPIQAEWIYAAHGGQTPTTFPWGDSPSAEVIFPAIPMVTVPTPYADDAYWEFLGIPVGSHPPAGSRFGHQDLIGGVNEYVRDASGGSTQDLIELTDDDVVPLQFGLGNLPNRLMIGAGWEGAQYTETLEGNWDRSYPTTGIGSGTTGFRCARDPAK